ncbi:MAG: DUF4956 domain-containing protein [Oscillospiraceae bacterium]|nr:DUF4956 domain-containing protein [Oscillospiraceae bacterium]
MVTFNDVIKQKFIDAFNTVTNPSFNIWTMLIALLIALALGVGIFFVYKYTFGGVMYSRTFNVSLLGLTVVTAFVILAVSSNVVLSLGMVGALSIVRFRTAIKDPMDLIFLFWAIGVGIVTGAQLYILAIVGSIIVAAIIYVSSQRLSFDSPYLVIINCDSQTSEDECVKIINSYSKKARLKSKIVSAGKGTEFIYEIRSKGENTGFVNDLSAVSGVQNASLVSYNGEFLD